jgi:hypothetical protein
VKRTENTTPQNNPKETRQRFLDELKKPKTEVGFMGLKDG